MITVHRASINRAFAREEKAMSVEAFRFDGKRALVVGGATGMGAAAAEILLNLGAEVAIMDYAEITTPSVQAIKLDLREKESIDAAVDAFEGPIDALLSCAGVASATPGLHKVNFIGQRHLIERLVNEDRMPEGSSIAMISSVAGFRWETDLPTLHEFLDTPDFESAIEWVDSRPDKTEAPLDYPWSKMAVCAYVARRAYSLLARKIRINAVLPGIIDTPLARANNWLGADTNFRESLGLALPTPEMPAYPLVFLCTQAASLMTGSLAVVDAGWVPAGITRTFENRFFTPLST
jgi:NAD(P)-dependent dehydrogenase (short-subunit alcohol dehydrogenase family)